MLRLFMIAMAVSQCIAVGSAYSSERPPLTTPYKSTESLTFGDQTLTAILYRSGGDVRREVLIEGKQDVSIVKAAAGTGWQFSLGDRRALEFDAADGGVDPISDWLQGVTFVLEGSEAAGGVAAQRYRVSPKSGTAGLTGKVWVAADGIILRIDGVLAGGAKPIPVSLNVGNISRNALDPSLFQLPPGIETFRFAPVPGRLPDALKDDSERLSNTGRQTAPTR